METALQQVGAGLLKTYRASKPAEQSSLSPVLISVQQRLQRRGWEGDDFLAAEMLAEIRHEQLSGRPLAIDLDELSTAMADHSDYPGADTSTPRRVRPFPRCSPMPLWLATTPRSI
jgi:hypothetical protein